MDDRELVRRAQAGDRAAFAQLVREHQRFVYNLALRAVHDPCEAEDLAQEAFLKAWAGLRSFRQEAQFRTWLYRIVVNLCYNRLPRLRQEVIAIPVEDVEEQYLEPEAGSSDPGIYDPGKRLEDQERRRLLHQEIEKLPESYRLMVMMRYQQDCAYEEIAEVMGIPLGTVKTGLFRARQQLRLALRSYEEVMV